MTRVGVFSGKTYDETVKPEDIHECCVLYYEENLPSEFIRSATRHNYRDRCEGCYGCEEAKKCEK